MAQLPPATSLSTVIHDYCRTEENMKISMISEEDFPSLPTTPMKPPSKKRQGVSLLAILLRNFPSSSTYGLISWNQ